ncbi:MAG TPA: hypothetical protein VL096_20770 [Pirellulaceae bacterium]|nr:hypothetical protein [Pirellulaceae bacterium]
MTSTAHQAGIVEGTRRRDAAQKLIEDHRPDYILAARRVLLTVALDRGFASVDDCRDAIELPPDRTNLGRFFAPLCKAGIVEVWRYVPSRRPENHARPVCMLRLLSPTLARAWLAENRPPDPPTKKPAVQRELFSGPNS